MTNLCGAFAPTARPEFVADLRSRLMLAAEGSLAPATPVRAPAARRSPRERRIAAAVGGFAIVSATASMAVAAQTALPGDTLYPLKRAIENAQAGVQQSDDHKGTTMLDNASGRLVEVDELSRADDQDARVISQTLQDFVDQASEASGLLLGDFADTGHSGSIEELRSFTAESIQALEQLQGVVPSEVRASLIKATEAVRRIDEQAQSACPACSDLPLTSMPDFAVKKIAPMLGDLVERSTEAVVAPPRTPTKPDTTPPSEPVGQPAPDTTTPPSASAGGTTDPVIPQAPGTGGNGKPGHGPLDDITTGAGSSDDPVGELISGTGQVVDDLVTGLTNPLKP
ncbi:hypothetical protein BH11ACT8_BH11ACT8_00490 [soil metagenome]